MQNAKSKWRVARASRQGSKNRQRNTECQDHCCWAAVPQVNADTLVAAVADGMGSARRSGHGSRIAVHAAVSKTIELLHECAQPAPPERIETILDAAVLSARRKIQQAAEREGVPSSSMATTLLLALHTNGVMATAQVGDGACVVSIDEHRYITFSKPQRGEYANETHSLTSKRALQHCRIDIAKADLPVRSIALMTDGMVGLTIAQANLEPHTPFFNKMSRWLAEHPPTPHPNTQLGADLESDQVRQKTDDDTTLLLAVRR